MDNVFDFHDPEFRKAHARNRLHYFLMKTEINELRQLSKTVEEKGISRPQFDGTLPPKTNLVDVAIQQILPQWNRGLLVFDENEHDYHLLWPVFYSTTARYEVTVCFLC